MKSGDCEKLVSLLADSKELPSVKLFTDDGRLPMNYLEVLNSLNGGGTVLIPNPKNIKEFVPFKIKGLFREGGISRFYELEDGNLLKVPNYWSQHRFTINPDKDGRFPHLPTENVHYFYFGAQHNFVDEAQLLALDKIPMVEIIDGSNTPFAIVLKKEKFQFNLKQFVNGERELSFSPEELATAEKRLLDFAERTWRYTSFPDFKFEHLEYNGREWLLVDIGGPPGVSPEKTLIRNFEENATVFSTLDEASPFAKRSKKLVDLLEKIETRVNSKRALEKEQKVGGWIERRPLGEYWGPRYVLIDEVTPIDSLQEGTPLVLKPFQRNRIPDMTSPSRRQQLFLSDGGLMGPEAKGFSERVHAEQTKIDDLFGDSKMTPHEFRKSEVKNKPWKIDEAKHDYNEYLILGEKVEAIKDKKERFIQFAATLYPNNSPGENGRKGILLLAIKEPENSIKKIEKAIKALRSEYPDLKDSFMYGGDFIFVFTDHPERCVIRKR